MSSRSRTLPLPCELLELRHLLSANVVADIGTLGQGSDPRLVGSFQGETHFVATTPDGLQILATDGTEVGTRSLLDVGELPRDTVPAVTTSVGSLYLRLESDAINRQSLTVWKSPTIEGESPTRLVTFDEQQAASDFRLLRTLEYEGRAYLLVRLGRKGVLASTDGTSNGSRVEETFDIQPADMAVAGDRFFVVAEGRLISKQASEPRFERVHFRHHLRTIVSVGDRVIVSGESGGVWAVDAENNLSNLVPTGVVRNHGANQSGYYFSIDDWQSVWHSYGTKAGTRRLASDIYVQNLVVTDDGAYFAIGGDSTTIWRSDGAEPPHEVVDLGTNQVIQDLAWSAGRLHFRVDGEYWTSDGTQIGTGPMGVVLHPGGVQELADGRVLFVGSRDGTNAEPWVSDGSLSGTQQIVELLPGTHSADFVDPKSNFEYERQRWRDFVAFRGQVYFGAEDALYRSDGTSQGTQKYFTSSEPRSILEPFKERSRVDEMHVEGGQLYFFVTTFDPKPRRAQAEIALWVTDGESPTTPEFGRELWKLDATKPGSAPVAIDTNPGPLAGMPEQMVALGTDVFFSSFTELLGRELWRYSPDDERSADFDGNGLVDFVDFVILSQNFGKQASATGADGDTNGDGNVDFEDFLYLSSRYTTQKEND